MTFIENHHGVQWKLCTQEHQLNVTMSHTIYMTMLHEVRMTFFSHMLTYNYLFDITMDNETQFVDVFKSGITNFKNCSVKEKSLILNEQQPFPLFFCENLCFFMEV
jgi:hypothetical protein